MNIAVVGGTGLLRQRVVEQVLGRDHIVKVLSRRSSRHPIDLTTGNGLDRALIGCVAVLNMSNDTSLLPVPRYFWRNLFQ